MNNNDYRARATRAEQEAAKLREELAKRPNYEWFVELVRKHLKQGGRVFVLNVWPTKLNN
nr:MAG TPA: Methyltransferase domain [Caudoviricetes sp.]